MQLTRKIILIGFLVAVALAWVLMIYSMAGETKCNPGYAVERLFLCPP